MGDPAADLKTIKTAYRRLARQYHPDVGTEKDAESKFKELAEAYKVLKDEKRLAEYDQFKLHRNDPRFFEQTHGYGGQRETGYGAVHTIFPTSSRACSVAMPQEADALQRTVSVGRILRWKFRCFLRKRLMAKPEQFLINCRSWMN